MSLRYGLLVLATVVGVAQMQCVGQAKPTVSKFIGPAYPALARLANIQGTLVVNFSLGANCEILGSKVEGHPPEILEKAILRTIMNRDVGLQFDPCQQGAPRNLKMYFHFMLNGQPTNEWVPTQLRVKSIDEGYTVEIVTRPGDLATLGLIKKEN